MTLADVLIPADVLASYGVFFTDCCPSEVEVKKTAITAPSASVPNNLSPHPKRAGGRANAQPPAHI